MPVINRQEVVSNISNFLVIKVICTQTIALTIASPVKCCRAPGGYTVTVNALWTLCSRDTSMSYFGQILNKKKSLSDVFVYSVVYGITFLVYKKG